MAVDDKQIEIKKLFKIIINYLGDLYPTLASRVGTRGIQIFPNNNPNHNHYESAKLVLFKEGLTKALLRP